MSREKQNNKITEIERMAYEMERLFIEAEIKQTLPKKHPSIVKAETLYNAGYRKQSEVIDEFVKMLKDTSMTKWDYHEAVDVEEIDRIAAKMKGGAE